MKGVWAFVFLLWAITATYVAWGFARDYSIEVDRYLAVKHERDELLVKYEGWHWWGNKVAAFKIPPDPYK